MTKTTIQISPTNKQWLAYQKLFDTTTNYVLFGGGAGSGKSYLIAQWLVYMCISYPQTKWFIGREELKRLMQSTFITFVEVCRNMNISNSQWKLDGKYNYIEFYNGSRIDLLDLKYVPSDPLYERFGSVEFTGGAIEEAGEVHFKAFDVLKSRINRKLNREYNIPPKILITCNPKKNWLYYVFYKPFQQNELPTEYAFIQSLYYDNPYTAESYKSSLLSITDKSTKERLMFGNWDYETGDDSLMPYQKLVELYTNTFVKPGDKKYIVVDVARFGKDRTVVSLWHGLVLKKWYVFGRQSTTETAKVVIALSDTHSVPRSQIIIDDGGISGGVVDQVSGCSPFLGARSSFNTESNNFVNYGNLRAQSYFKLADMVNTNQIYIEDTEYKEVVLEELEQIKKKDIEKEGKIYIVEKEKMKEVLGRSPDFADVLQMRMLPELVNQEAFVLTDESGLIF